jgi:hypothetical protein
MSAVWVVTVDYEDDDPATYGPYTRLQAERVEVKINDEARLATSSDGVNHHPFNVQQAIAVPLSRYDAFLDAEQRRAVRREVREDRE